MKETKTVGGAIALAVGVVLLAVLAGAAGGWLLMLTVGVIHAVWIHALPTIGFKSAVLVSVMLYLTHLAVAPGSRGSSK